MFLARIMAHIFHMCRSHFYKVLVLVILGLMALQYGLSVAFYGGKSYFPVPNPLLLYGGGGSSSSNSKVAANVTAIAALNVTTLTSTLSSSIRVEQTTAGGVALSNSPTTSSPGGVVSNVSLAALVVGSSASTLVGSGVEHTLIVGTRDASEPTLTTLLSTAPNKTAKVLAPCPAVPPKLVGPVKVLTDSPSMEDLESQHSELELGGRFRPPECKSKHKVAIIIPYRDREAHLKLFLYNIHPILQRQQIDYGIFVVEEAGDTKFNRAMLMNIGFVEALKAYDWQCFVFHDVDLLPEDDRNIYSCPEQPRHMSVAVNTMGYKLPYKDIFGGVSVLTKQQMETVNGFSNQFWGWGGEDDDMSNRIRFYGYKISRYSPKIAKYMMMKHTKDKPNPDRYNKLYKGKLRYKTDGINSLKYEVKATVLKRLYTWVLVQVDPPK